MRVTVVTQIKIHAPPEEVFEYLANLKYHYLWNPQLRNLSSTKHLRLGSEYQAESVILGTTIEATNQVTGFVPLKELVLENNLGAVHYSARFQLTKNGRYTVVKLTTTVSTDSKVFSFTLPILKKLAQRELRTDLQALKIAVEDKLQ